MLPMCQRSLAGYIASPSVRARTVPSAAVSVSSHPPAAIPCTLSYIATWWFAGAVEATGPDGGVAHSEETADTAEGRGFAEDAVFGEHIVGYTAEETAQNKLEKSQGKFAVVVDHIFAAGTKRGRHVVR